MGAGLWAKPLPDLVAAGHQGLQLSGALHLGPSAPRTGAGLRISLAKPGRRKGSSRDWVKDSTMIYNDSTTYYHIVNIYQYLWF